MSVSKELDLRRRVGEFMERNSTLEDKDIVRHFELEGKHRKTIYRIISRLRSGVSVERQPGSGQWHAVDQKTKDKIIAFSVNKVGVSYRAIGRKFSKSDVPITGQTVKKVLINAGVNRRKRKKCPKTNENQLERQKKCLEKLRRGVLKASSSVEIIMDDESYYTIDGSDTNFNDFFYSSEELEVPEEVRFRPVAKFPKKVMVWIAMSSKGFSEPYIVPSGNAVNAKTYIDNCLTRLKDFIDKYHSDENYVFWPDLASSHYARITTQVMDSVGIKYVRKDENPPNVPQLRPIETFWAYLQRKLYENGWQAENIKQLSRRIRFIIRKTPEDLCQRLMRKIKTNVRKAADGGALKILN
jgi:hypothetical protein